MFVNEGMKNDKMRKEREELKGNYFFINFKVREILMYFRKFIKNECGISLFLVIERIRF